jgi:hypothetical protein
VAGFFAYGKEVYGPNHTKASNEWIASRLSKIRNGVKKDSKVFGQVRCIVSFRLQKQLQMREQPVGDFRRFLIAPHGQIPRDLPIGFVQWLKLRLEVAFRNPAILGVD